MKRKTAGTFLAPAVFAKRATRLRLPVASAVESTATVKTTAAMECFAAMRCYATEAWIAMESTAKSARTGTTETSAATEDRSRVEAAAIEAVKPGTRADKYPAGKILRAIVAVRSAGVRSKAVVAVRANGSRTNEERTNPNRHLCIGSTRHHHEQPY